MSLSPRICLANSAAKPHGRALFSKFIYHEVRRQKSRRWGRWWPPHPHPPTPPPLSSPSPSTASLMVHSFGKTSYPCKFSFIPRFIFEVTGIFRNDPFLMRANHIWKYRHSFSWSNIYGATIAYTCDVILVPVNARKVNITNILSLKTVPMLPNRFCILIHDSCLFAAHSIW